MISACLKCCGCYLGFAFFGVLLILFFIWMSRNDDLPKGARKYKGPLNIVLKILHEERIKLFRKQGIRIYFQESSFDSLGAINNRRDFRKETKEKLCIFLFGRSSYPMVDGYAWDQAFAIPVGKNGNYLLLYESSVVPRDHPRPYLLYTLGDVSKEEIEKFVSFLTQEFNRLRAEAEKKQQTKP